MESLKFENVEDAWNNFKKIIWEVADGVLRKKIGNEAWNISENSLRLIEIRRGLYKHYWSNRSYENKKNVKKVRAH